MNALFPPMRLSRPVAAPLLLLGALALWTTPLKSERTRTASIALQGCSGPTYNDAHGTPGGQVCVPQGADAFAVSVVSFTPGTYTLNTPCPNTGQNNPPTRAANQMGTASGALGPPDVLFADFQTPSVRLNNDASLGGRGQIVLRFKVPLTGDGTAAPDVWVWEVGQIAEVYRVDVSPNGSAWTTVGQANGTTNGSQGFNIDDDGFGPTARLFYVRITDIDNNNDGCQAGADIDAVAVLSNITASIGLTKSAKPASGVHAGDQVTYSFTVINSGTDTLINVTVTDPLPGMSAIKCPVTTLAPNESALCSATYTVTAADVTAGSIVNTATVTGTPQAGGPQVMASATATVTPAVVPPSTIDLAVNKEHVGTFVHGETGTYTLTVTNVSSSPSTGTVTLIDTPPPGLPVTSIGGPGWTCVLATLTCTRSDALLPKASYDPVTVVVNVPASTPAGTLTNTVVISGGGDSNPANNTDSDVTPIIVPVLPDLAVTKAHVGTFVQGQTGTYTLTVSNVSATASSGTVTMVDSPPAGLTVTGMSGSGWTCTVGTLTCTRADALAPSASYPVVTVTVSIAANAPAGTLTNVVTISGGGDTNPANNTDMDPTPIVVPTAPVDLTITKEHTGSLVRGQSVTYTITVVNVSGTTTSGVTTVLDALPAGLTASAVAGIGWSCTLATLTCTRGDVLASGASYPVILLTAAVAESAPIGNATNTATVSGGGDSNPSNNTATDTGPIVEPPPGPTPREVVDLSIAKSHAGSFTRGQNGNYSLVVANVSGAPSSGAVTVSDTLPAGMIATTISGTGWACTLATVTCTRSDALAAGATYPAITIAVIVTDSVPVGTVINTAAVSGGGDANPANNNAADPTSIVSPVPVPTLPPWMFMMLAVASLLVAIRILRHSRVIGEP